MKRLAWSSHYCPFPRHDQLVACLFIPRFPRARPRRKRSIGSTLKIAAYARPVEARGQQRCGDVDKPPARRDHSTPVARLLVHQTTFISCCSPASQRCHYCSLLRTCTLVSLFLLRPFDTRILYLSLLSYTAFPGVPFVHTIPPFSLFWLIFSFSHARYLYAFSGTNLKRLVVEATSLRTRDPISPPGIHCRQPFFLYI